MEKKTHKLVNRAEFIQSYLKNPYNLTPQSTEANTIYYNSLPSPKSHTRFLRKVLSPSKHKPTLPELNGNNAFYLSKTSLAFRKTREEWQSQLNFCLQSKSVNTLPSISLDQRGTRFQTPHQA